MKRMVLTLCACLWVNGVSAQTSLLPTLQSVRPRFPTPMSPAQLGEFLNTVAWQHRADGWGLLRKDGGNNCPSPATVLVSCDFLVHAPTATGFDVLIASETEAVPTWAGPFPIEPARFVAPTDPLTVSQPAIPPAAVTQLDRVEEKLDAVSVSLEAHRAESRKVRNQVIAFLTNWQNVAKIGSGLLAGWVMRK